MKNPAPFIFLMMFLFIFSLMGTLIFGIGALFTPTSRCLTVFSIFFVALVLIVIWMVRQPTDKEKTK